MGANARRRVLANHTVRHRVDEMWAVLNDRFGIGSDIPDTIDPRPPKGGGR